MSTKPTDKRDRLRELATKYNLGKEDFFRIHNNVIVTRTGVEKIANSAGINLRYEVIHMDLDKKHACVKCIAEQVFEDGVVLARSESFGESTPYNTKNSYPVAMAEKRAKARPILQLTEFYQVGVYAEDESDDFKKG